MSGGSYDYLCDAAGDVEDLGRKVFRLREMAARLDGIDADGHAACDTREVLAIIAALEHASKRLREVWRAVEWWDSCDIGEDQAMKALVEYEQARSAEEIDAGPVPDTKEDTTP